MPHTYQSFGSVPEKQWREALEAPFGGARKILRKYVPTFGMKEGETGKFKIEVSRRYSRLETATVYVDAENEEQARELVYGLDWDGFDWLDEGEDCDSDEIESIEAAS